MLTPEKIEEWLKEVEERPGSAANIIRYIANRLSELIVRNEELLAENIELRNGRKVEEYERRIANLEYQVDLLKRQLGGKVTIREPAEVETSTQPEAPPALVEMLSFVLYNIYGQILRCEVRRDSLTSRQTIARFSEGFSSQEIPPRLLAVNSQEELLFVFDSGRSTALPVSGLPLCATETLSWANSTLQEPRGVEELAIVQPIARMSLYEYCVQTSRRGLVKKFQESAFENHIGRGYIGSGIKQAPDKTCNLTFCNQEDLLVLVSKEGFLTSQPVSRLPYSIEEVVKLGAVDHIVSTFVTGQEPSLVMVTHNGKAIQRQMGWLEPPASFKSRGQAIFSQARREAGVRVVGASAVDEEDWGFSLTTDGKLTAYQMKDIFASGSLYNEMETAEIISFVTMIRTSK